MRVERNDSDARSDESLLAAMAAGDEQAGVAFVRRYQRRVFGLARGLLGDVTLAEDVAQEALLRVWRHAPVFDARRGSVTTWVLTITRNLAVDQLRMRRSVPADPEDLAALGLVAEAADPADLAAGRGDLRNVAHVLRALPATQRRALLLSAYYGLSASEVAAREEIPLGTAKTRIRASMQKVRAALVPAPGPVFGEGGERV